MIGPYKSNHAPSLWPNNSTSSYLLLINDYMGPYEDLQNNMYSNFIHSSQELKIRYQ